MLIRSKIHILDGNVFVEAFGSILNLTFGELKKSSLVLISINLKIIKL